MTTLSVIHDVRYALRKAKLLEAQGEWADHVLRLQSLEACRASIRGDRVAMAHHVKLANQARNVVKLAKIAANEKHQEARKLAQDAHLDFRRFA